MDGGHPTVPYARSHRRQNVTAPSALKFTGLTKVSKIKNLLWVLGTVDLRAIGILRKDSLLARIQIQ